MAKSLWFQRFFVASDAPDWEQVYAQTLPKVFNYALYRVDDVAQAEDITAMTFERAWKHRQRYRHDQAALLTWMLGITRNLIADAHRRQRSTAPLDETTPDTDDAAPEKVIERTEQRAKLHRLLLALPPRERELIALKYGADLNNRQIAQTTGLSESNVGTILHRTIQQLRLAWEAENEQ